jgi:hypothetical protein
MLLSVGYPGGGFRNPRTPIPPPRGRRYRGSYQGKSGKHQIVGPAWDGSQWSYGDAVSTAVVVAIVVVLMLLGLGIVINQLLRLRQYLNDSPSEHLPDPDAGDAPEHDPPK